MTDPRKQTVKMEARTGRVLRSERGPRLWPGSAASTPLGTARLCRAALEDATPGPIRRPSDHRSNDLGEEGSFAGQGAACGVPSLATLVGQANASDHKAGGRHACRVPRRTPSVGRAQVSRKPSPRQSPPHTHAVGLPPTVVCALCCLPSRGL